MSQAAIMGMLSAWNANSQPQGAPSAMASTGSGAASGGSASSSAAANTGITANDFLTLLVTEMQNQDPTADVDPNQYISQLVQINSLEQLISINQNTTAAAGTGSGTGTSSGTGTGTTSGSATGAAAPSGKAAVAPSATKGMPGSVGHAHGVRGNLSLPPISASAEKVAQSLGQPHGQPGYGHAIRDIPLPRFTGSKQ